MNLRGFLRQLAGVGAASMADRVVGLLLGILLARWLGVENYGLYAFVMATVALLLIPAKLGLPDLIMREFAAFRADAQRGATAQDWLSKARGAVFFMSIALYASAALVVFSLVDDARLALAFHVGLLLLPVLALLDLHAYALRGLGRAVLAQYSAGLFGSLLVLVFVAVLAGWALPDPAYALGARLAAVSTALGLTAWLLHRRLADIVLASSAGIDTGIGALLKAGFPFLMIGGVAIIMTRTDVVMLGFLTSTREVGLYNAALQGAMLVSLLLNTSNTIVAPEFSRLYVAGDTAALERFAVHSARVVVLLALPLVLALVFWGGDLLGILFGAEFAAGGTVLAILSISFFLSLLFGEPGFLLNMTGHQTTTFRVFLFAALLNVGLNALLIPSFGPVGAALASGISRIVQRSIMTVAVRRAHGISVSCFGGRWGK